MGTRIHALVYDRVLDASERAGLAARRAALLADARGAVLEIGAGTGLNLPHYPDTVTRLVLTDPDPHMRRRLEERAAATPRDVEVWDADAAALPFLENTFDEAVTTLALCTVGRRMAALHEIRRVLRAGGRLRFLEHVAAMGRGRALLQRVVAPAHAAVTGGCRLDQRMTDGLRRAGFVIETVSDWTLPRAVPWVRPAVVGVARAPGGSG